MGQKVHPTGFRLGVIRDWSSRWYADSKKYADYLNTDLAVREFLRQKLRSASVSAIQIERPANNARIVVHTARPGIVIGKKGEDIESLAQGGVAHDGCPGSDHRRGDPKAGVSTPISWRKAWPISSNGVSCSAAR